MALRFCYIGMLVATACVSVVAQEAGKPASKLSFDEVVQGIERAEQAVKTLSVEMQVKRMSDLTWLMPTADKSRSVFAESWHIDSCGIGWNTAVGTTTRTKSDGRIRQTHFDHRGTFDGENGAQLVEESNDGRNPGLNASVSKSLIRYGMSPFDFTFAHQAKLVSQSLKSRGGEIVRQDTWKGRDVLVIESKPVENNGQYKSQYWVDPERNFTIVRRRTMSRQSDDAAWHAYYSVESLGHKEVVAGVWLPTMALKRSFSQPTKEHPDGPVNSSVDVRCANWKINVPVDPASTKIAFPQGLKIRGMEPPEANLEKSKNYFVIPVTTPLQRKLIGLAQNETAYAKIDVTAIMDVNTRHIVPLRFDLEGFKQKLREVNGLKKDGGLFLSFDFGALGATHDENLFVTAAITEFAKQCGFQKIRPSYSYHNDGRLWKGLDGLKDRGSDETDIGQGAWEVYEVGTPLSQYFSKNTDFLIRARGRLPNPPERLLTEEDLAIIQESLKGRDLHGKSLEIKLHVGGNRDRLKNEEQPFVQQGSKMQRNTVDALRDLGFGQIRLIVRVGPTNFVSMYTK